jgi:translation initiation factor IF-2
MHRRRAATFLSRSYRASQARSASSAAAYATRSVPEPDEGVAPRPTPPNLSKWARPAALGPSTSQKQQQYPNRRPSQRDTDGRVSSDRSSGDSSNAGRTVTTTRQDMFRNARQSNQTRQRPVPQARDWGLGSPGSKTSGPSSTQTASSSQTRIQRRDLPHTKPDGQRSGAAERRKDGPSGSGVSSSVRVESGYVDAVGFAEETERGRHRRDKFAFRERGSLVPRDGEVLVEDRVGAKAELERRQQQRRAKAAMRKRPRQLVEVYIPNIVSVGQLAQLLKVKLGMLAITFLGNGFLNIALDRLQRKMREAGMGEEASYDHGLSRTSGNVMIH